MVMGKVSALVVRSLRMSSSSELGSISRKGLERDYRIVDSVRHYSQSSTSGWGTGEPIEEDTQERGVSPGGPPSSTGTAAAAEKPIGRQAETTSTSGFDTGAEVGGDQKQRPKKSRTGRDMSEDGQVHTPNLQRNRSTRDFIKNAGKEQAERLAQEKKSAS
ncbi:unnamed protein product [Calypogeia fissa]